MLEASSYRFAGRVSFAAVEPKAVPHGAVAPSDWNHNWRDYDTPWNSEKQCPLLGAKVCLLDYHLGTQLGCKSSGAGMS